MEKLEADYVIVGAGAVGLAFADTMLSQSNARMILVDRRDKPGGHWNDAYSFVRLHSPSANYGVNSRPFSDEGIERDGPNRGLQGLARGAEVCAYFEALMRERLLPSGRVRFLGGHEFEHGHARNRATGARTQLVAHRKLVDATLAQTRIPATHTREFSVAAGLECVAPNAIGAAVAPGRRFVVLGAGKTAMDAALRLLTLGAPPGAVTWIRPRDAWMLNRHKMQTDFRFFADTFEALAVEMEAAREAQSLKDLFARLEAADVLRRIDKQVTPTMYRCAIVSDCELEAMRQITNVVRLGRVRAIEPERIVLERGAIESSPQSLFVDCTGDGLPKHAPQPIFQDGRIALQYVRRCSPPFSAAFVAYVEAARANDAEKNALCAPAPVPHEPLDWLRMHLVDARNRQAWSKAPDVQAFLAGSRLDGFSALLARALAAPTPKTAALLQRYRDAQPAGLARLSALVRSAGG